MGIDIEGLAPLLQVFEMPTSIQFYREVLGFDLVSTSHPGDHFCWCLLRLNGAELMLNTAYEADSRPAALDPARVAAHADTILYFGCADVDAAHTYLSAKWPKVEKPVTQGYGMKQMYVTDPDGYGLCFQWPANG